MDSASTEGVEHAFAAASRDMTGSAEPQGQRCRRQPNHGRLERSTLREIKKGPASREQETSPARLAKGHGLRFAGVEKASNDEPAIERLQLASVLFGMLDKFFDDRLVDG